MSGAARDRLSTEGLHAPHLRDTEVVAALRTLVLRTSITNATARRAIGAWTQLGLTRSPTIGLVDRVWELRSNVSAYLHLR